MPLKSRVEPVKFDTLTPPPFKLRAWRQGYNVGVVIP